MSFKNVIKRKNKLLLPISWLYVAGVRIFNFLYDSGLKGSTRFSLPLICVGNLSVGGTGKSPMVEYLVRLLKEQYSIAVVSRGYKRKTKGLLMASATTTADDIGDEPMQLHKKFPGVPIAVSAQRAVAVAALLRQQKPEVIILDDAFQHRALQAGFNILLTEYSNLFADDYYLPAGQLRDLKSNYKRAQCIIVTKCPPDLTSEQARATCNKLQPVSGQPVFFAALKYGQPQTLFGNTPVLFESVQHLLLVTGIANPLPLKRELQQYQKDIRTFYFEDHYDFEQKDIVAILEAYHRFPPGTAAIITTEKDGARLQKFQPQLERANTWCIPVSHSFLLGETEKFNILINDFIRNVDKQKNKT
ncbi:tetraacyldisaccharide 4'-kinase [Niabella ginsenosidivorans]|uniref:Tetraacyldisaccharide 4'-kinase n=1 Tax=Niabella ginsenosidivorans TaxID=1176587 RepID=A0A1A9I2Z3_9BACT|nr:tetraacyldisaccharide 4'-kinase [Niabella ginsenosidivorans]ANH81052.1 tetraacyldisaccharide 4'-kinase [Niabella ginsenosidivorans]